MIIPPRAQSMATAGTLVCACLMTCPAHAIQGLLRARDGQSFSGFLRLESNAVVVANLDQAKIFRVALSNVQVLQVTTPPAPETSTLRSITPAPTPWTNAEVGQSLMAGDLELQQDRLRLSSHHQRLSRIEDAAQFACTSMPSSGEIAVHLLRPPVPDPYALSGVMLRTSLDPKSEQIFLGRRTTGTGLLEWRTQYGDPVRQSSLFLLPWLRLKWIPTSVDAYTSNDGQRWRWLGQIPLALDDELLVGCAVTRSPGTQNTPNDTPAMAQFNQIRVGQGLRYHSFIPQIHLHSGSRLVQDIAYTHKNSLRFAGVSPWPDIPIPVTSLIQFQWIPERWNARIQQGRRGVLLAGGEFLEGELKQFESGTCIISTVLFGLRRFDGHHDLIALVLSPSATVATPWEIRTWNGSILKGQVLSGGHQGFLVREPVLGQITVPFHAIKEVARIPAS